jgi:hypothetical protein
MKNKTLAVAVVVLAALCALVYWFNRPPAPPPADPRVGQTVFASAAVEKAAGIRITDQGKTVTLARQADGSWRVDSYYGAPADFSKLSSLINDFTSVKIDRLVTRNPDRIARLDFGGTRVELLDGTGHVAVRVDLGRNADQGGRFIRYDSEAQAYLANLTSWIDNEAKNWADSSLVNIKADDVARMEIRFPAAPPIVMTRVSKSGAWTAADLPAGKQLIADKVNSTLSTLTSLRFSDTSDLSDPQAAAAKSHALVFGLTAFDGKTVSIALGRRPEEKKLKAPAPTPASAKGPVPMAKPAAPEYETIPAGPVFAFIKTSDPRAPTVEMMRKRSFQVDEYSFTGLPQKPSELLEAAPPKPPAHP